LIPQVQSGIMCRVTLEEQGIIVILYKKIWAFCFSKFSVIPGGDLTSTMTQEEEQKGGHFEK